MIAICSDTHSTGGHQLEGAPLEAVRDASAVLHVGDFTSTTALEAFQSECDRLYAVHGNADSVAVRDRLPTARTVEHDGLRIAMTHRRDGGETGLAMFGRSRDAEIVVSGHTHQPTVVETDDVLLLNPGSHADPRGNTPGFATIEVESDAFEGRLLATDGTVLETFGGQL
ncbi:phosphoesterase [Halostagnicola larsenii XH-48]|uniref:Phosphoesterase n=1 Tax=Halostagnicola larsenii XH-48 TaxID=797299 RepID=W0JIH3_9EURY|nr:metallophosphoesterase [Halostagnicola larsenii]AHF98403.1 phosphoesterase [Halostagnicola larsenii XH-48]